MASTALEGLPAEAELGDQIFHLWSNWMTWAVENPEKRRALTQLGVSDETTLSVVCDLAEPASIHRAAALQRDRAGLESSHRSRNSSSWASAETN
jgi:hypothetical protein